MWSVGRGWGAAASVRETEQAQADRRPLSNNICLSALKPHSQARTGAPRAQVGAYGGAGGAPGPGANWTRSKEGLTLPTPVRFQANLSKRHVPFLETQQLPCFPLPPRQPPAPISCFLPFMPLLICFPALGQSSLPSLYVPMISSLQGPAKTSPSQGSPPGFFPVLENMTSFP